LSCTRTWFLSPPFSTRTTHLPSAPPPVRAKSNPAGAAPTASDSKSRTTLSLAVRGSVEHSTIAKKTECLIAPPSMRKSGLLNGNLAEGRLQSLGDLRRIVDAPEVHEEQPRHFPEHVRVEGRHLDPVALQFTDDRGDLVGDQHEIARGRHALARHLEVQR